MDEEKEVRTDSDISDSSLLAYLLGDLKDEQQMQTIEQLILSSDDFAESVFIAEDSFIEDYLDDALSKEDRQKIEKVLKLSGDMRERLRLIKELQVVANSAIPVRDNRKASPRFSPN
jgi:hypothetical protein